MVDSRKGRVTFGTLGTAPSGASASARPRAQVSAGGSNQQQPSGMHPAVNQTPLSPLSVAVQNQQPSVNLTGQQSTNAAKVQHLSSAMMLPTTQVQQPPIPEHQQQENLINLQHMYQQDQEQPFWYQQQQFQQIPQQNVLMGSQSNASRQKQLLGSQSGYTGVQSSPHSGRQMFLNMMPFQQSSASMLPPQLQQQNHMVFPFNATPQRLPPVGAYIQQQVGETRKQQTVEESHQAAVSFQNQNQIPTLQGVQQLMSGNNSIMRQPMQNPQAQLSMQYLGNSNAALAMQMHAMALERNIDLQNAHMIMQSPRQQKVNGSDMAPQSKQPVTFLQLPSESSPRSHVSLGARQAMSPGSTSNTFLVNNSGGGAQVQQQGSVDFKQKTTFAQKMSNFFQRGHIQPLMVVDPHGDLHAVDKVTRQCYWSTKTGRHAFKFLKDENTVLESYFRFTSDASRRERLGSCLVDENEIHLIHNEESYKVEGHSVKSLKKAVGKLDSALSSDFKVTGSTEEELWVHVGSGNVVKYRPLDTKEHILVIRKDFNVCNKVNDWELSFSDFEVYGDVEGRRVRDESIEMAHCRDYEKYFMFMEKFKIRLENLTVFYDKRCRWEDGRVTFKGRFKRYAELTDVIAEVVAPVDYAKRLSEHYIMLGWHKNILRFYDQYDGFEDTFLLFESYDHKLTDRRKEDPDGREVMRSVLSGVLHLFDKNCLHGKLKAGNVVITAENEVKLCGLLPRPIPSKGAKEKEMIPSKNDVKKEMKELGQLLKYFVFGNVSKVPESYKATDPLAYDLFRKLMSNSNRYEMVTMVSHVCKH